MPVLLVSEDLYPPLTVALPDHEQKEKIKQLVSHILKMSQLVETGFRLLSQQNDKELEITHLSMSISLVVKAAKNLQQYENDLDETNLKKKEAIVRNWLKSIPTKEESIRQESLEHAPDK